jgi:hypothetical protein
VLDRVRLSWKLVLVFFEQLGLERLERRLERRSVTKEEFHFSCSALLARIHVPVFETAAFPIETKNKYFFLK